MKVLVELDEECTEAIFSHGGLFNCALRGHGATKLYDEHERVINALYDILESIGMEPTKLRLGSPGETYERTVDGDILFAGWKALEWEDRQEGKSENRRTCY